MAKTKKPLLNQSLKRAVDIAGGQAQLAKGINELIVSHWFFFHLRKIRQGHIWAWLYRTGQTPATYVLVIEMAVQSAVTRYELRPDLYPLTWPPPLIKMVAQDV